MKFRRLFALAVAGIMTMSFTACGNNSQSADSDTFKIGGIGPLTGDAANYGNSVKNGCQVAVDEINAAGGANGKKLELLFEDDVNDAEKSVNAYNTLMDQGVQAIVGSVTSSPCIAVAAESEKDGILQITPSGSAKECTAGSNAFRICFTDPLQGEVMAKYIKDKGINKIAMIYDVSNDYSKGIHDAFAAKFTELGGQLVDDESFAKGDIDFKTQLTKVKTSGAEALFLPIYYTEVGYISQQAATLGLNIPYYGCDGWDGIIKQLNGDTKNIEGATYLTPFVATDTSEKVQAFVNTYKEKYNAEPDQFAADGYDAVYAIKAAIEKAGDDTSNEALVSAMTQISVNGLTGDMTFDENGEPNKSAKVVVIKDGQYVAQN